MVKEPAKDFANTEATNDGDSSADNVRRLNLPSSDSEMARSASVQEPTARKTSPQGEEAVKSSSTSAIRKGFGFSRRTILFALLPLALVIGLIFYATGGRYITTENAYVQADTVGVATDVSGLVKSIDVKDNQQVKIDDVLFRLDDRPYRLALERAEAQLGNVRNDLAALQANYRDMQTQIAQAQADIDYYTVAFKRQQQLATNNFTPQATYDDARHNLAIAQQKLASVREQLAALAANLNGDPEAPTENHPRYRDAQAARDEAARQLSHTIVRAPIAGIVTKVPSLQPGQYLGASVSAMSIVATDRVWIQANPKETELTNVKSGQPATIEVDSYPGMEWRGVVDSISPASASSFSLLPAENSSGNWVKVVQRIPLRVRIDDLADKPQLRAGMSVVLSIDTGHARGLHLFGGRGG